MSERHARLGDITLCLAGLGTAALVYHHRVRKDGALLSMMPRRL